MFLENLSLPKQRAPVSLSQRDVISHIYKNGFSTLELSWISLAFSLSSSHTPSQRCNLSLSHTAVIPTVHILSNRYMEGWRLKSTNTETQIQKHTHTC